MAAWRSLLCAWLALSLVACQGTYQIVNPTRAHMEREFKPGDEIVVGYRDGRMQSLRLISYGKTGLKGDFGGQEVTVDYKDIRSIDYARVDGSQTGATILVGVIAVAGIAIWAVRRLLKAVENVDED